LTAVSTNVIIKGRSIEQIKKEYLEKDKPVTVLGLLPYPSGADHRFRILGPGLGIAPKIIRDLFFL